VNSWTLCAKKSEFAVLATSNQYAPSLTLEPIHLDVDLKFNIAERKAEGYVINKIRANTKDADKIVLNAIDIDIKDVSAGDSKISWDYDKKNIFIQFEDKFDLYEERSVKIGYSVNNPVAGLYFSYPNEKNPNAPITVGSDHETERARHWIPSIDSPIVRPTINFTLTSDESHTILAIGKLVNEKTNNDGTKTAFWEHNYPCPLYIAAIAIGELTEYKDRSVVLDGIERPIAYYSGKDFTSEQLKLTFGRTPEMIEWFCEKFGHSIAWTKYYQFAFRGIGGAMENQSLVSWDDMLVQDGDTIEEFKDLVDSVNVHELAHTFFGDMVVIKDFGHGWLKESWATYLSALWLEDKYNKDEFHYDMYKNANSYFNEADNRYTRSIVTRKFKSSWEMFDGHLYPGGSWRIHMLRQMIGDEKFFGAINDYIGRYMGKTVETIDFQRILEEHSGLNLDKFFDDWVLTANKYPDLEIDYTFDEKLNLEHYKSEKFWGVRLEIIKELGNSTSLTAKNALLDITNFEKNPLIYSQLAISLGKYQDSKAKTALLILLQKENIGAYAKGEVYANLGLLRDVVSVEDFIPGLEDVKSLHRVQRGAIRGLSNLRTEEAWKKLVDIFEGYETPNFVRNTLALALANCSIWLKDEQKEKTIDLLIKATQEDMDRIRMAAASSLQQLEAKSAIRALEDMKALHPYQDQVAIDKIILKIREKVDQSSPKELQTTINDLTKQVSDLVQRIEKLEALKLD
jgi:hypothetical protein